MIATGIVLSIASFLWLKFIHQSVLMYTGEAVGFASAVFGLTVYSASKVRENREIMREEFEQLKQELLNQPNQDYHQDETLHDQ